MRLAFLTVIVSLWVALAACSQEAEPTPPAPDFVPTVRADLFQEDNYVAGYRDGFNDGWRGGVLGAVDCRSEGPDHFTCAEIVCIFPYQPYGYPGLPDASYRGSPDLEMQEPWDCVAYAKDYPDLCERSNWRDWGCEAPVR